MLIKSIIAEVPENDRASFPAVRQSWSGLKAVPGFVARTGGWTKGACVFLEWWRDRSGYHRFIETQHEVSAPEPGSYDKISVSLGNVIMTVNERDPLRLLPGGAFLRLSDCTLKPRCSPIFVATQLQIWNPAMRSAEGMLGAMVSRLDKAPDRFSIVSFWKDRFCHEQYEQKIYPAIYERSRVSEYLAEMSIYRVPLEEGWCVLAGV